MKEIIMKNLLFGTRMRRYGAILLLITLGITLTACTALLPKPRYSMSPPDWIQGKWSDQQLPEAVYTFTPTSFLMTMGNTTLNYGEMARLGEFHISEIKTDTLYSFTWITSEAEGLYQTMEFSRVDDNTLSYTYKSNVSTTGPILLVRQ